MNEYIGVVGEKIKVEAVYKKYFEYRTHYTYYGETHSIYLFEDEDGNCIVWNTTGIISDRNCVNERGDVQTIYRGSKLLITATVKAHSEYKGTKQTALIRPRFRVIELGKSPEEIQREKEVALEHRKKIQLESITADDFVWRMPYKQYKEHYSDCETIIDSYRCGERETATISVIIRAGRLKNSGVRGKHFSGYEFTSTSGLKVCYRAVSEENARKRMKKDYPDSELWECTHIYKHRYT